MKTSIKILMATASFAVMVKGYNMLDTNLINGTQYPIGGGPVALLGTIGFLVFFTPLAIKALNK